MYSRSSAHRDVKIAYNVKQFVKHFELKLQLKMQFGYWMFFFLYEVAKSCEFKNSALLLLTSMLRTPALRAELLVRIRVQIARKSASYYSAFRCSYVASSIFVFTDHMNNRFQKKLVMQNTNI